MQPAVDDGLCGGFGIFKVTFENTRGFDQDFTVIGNFDLNSFQWFSHSAELDLTDGAGGGDTGPLGLAVPFHEVHTDGMKKMQDFRRDGRCTGIGHTDAVKSKAFLEFAEYGKVGQFKLEFERCWYGFEIHDQAGALFTDLQAIVENQALEPGGIGHADHDGGVVFFPDARYGMPYRGRNLHHVVRNGF